MSRERLFRKSSLERMSTPDRLDTLLEVVKPQSWIVLLLLGVGIAVAVAWGFLGKLPKSVEGSALLIFPRQIVAFQSPGTGQLVSLDVRIGSHVKQGEVIGRINLPEVQKMLDQERSRLSQFESRDQKLTEYDRAQAEREKQLIEVQRGLLLERRKSLEAMASTLRAKNREYNTEQRRNLLTSREISTAFGKTLEERFDTYRALREEGLSAADAVLNARRNVMDNELRLADLDVRVHEIGLREIQSEENYLRSLDQIAEIDIELQALALKESQVDGRLLHGSISSETQIDEIRRSIARLEEQLRTRGNIVAEREGRVLEITATVGSFVQTGSRIGSMEAEDDTSPLVAVAYLKIEDGKRVSADMQARVSPSTVQRERYGSIIGRVLSVSDYPVTAEAVANQVGSRELATELMKGGNAIEVMCSLSIDDSTISGYRWTSAGGPDVAITAGTNGRVRVTVEEVPPVTLLLPFLKSWLGAN